MSNNIEVLKTGDLTPEMVLVKYHDMMCKADALVIIVDHPKVGVSMVSTSVTMERLCYLKECLSRYISTRLFKNA